jgi:hypothetical protein
MQRLAILVTAAVAATVIATVVATSGGAQVPGERTFKVIEGAGGTDGFVDNPPKVRNRRVSAGDVFVFTSPLFNEADRRIGILEVACTITRGGTARRTIAQCNGTYRLRDGTLAASAILQRDDATISVVGGTGAYEGARGSITDEELPRGRTENTIHLLP